MGYQSRVLSYDFQNLTFPASAGDGPFISEGTVTNQNGAAALNPGGVAAGIWQNDAGPAMGKELLRLVMAVKLNAAAGAGDEVAWGLGGTYNNAPGSVSPRALFRLSGSNEIMVETHDGTNGSGVVGTGIQAKTEWQRCEINFYAGVQTVAPPGVSKGGLGSVLFSVEDAAGQLTPVAKTTLFDLSATEDTFYQIIGLADGASVQLWIKSADLEVRHLP